MYHFPVAWRKKLGLIGTSQHFEANGFSTLKEFKIRR